MPLCRECRGLVSAEDERCPRCGTPTKEPSEQPAPAAPPNALEQRVLDIVRQGNKIEAIKVYREETGVGLKDAKDAVEALAVRHGVPIASGCGKAAALLMLLVGGGTLLAVLLVVR